MKLGLAIGYSGPHLDVPVALVQRAEELRCDTVWPAEAYGSDAITPLAFLAAVTNRIKLSCLVTDDAERDWPAERYCGQLYRSFNKDESAAGSVSGNTREASIPQTWVVGNVDHCMKELTSFVHEYGITDLVTWAVPPGMRAEQMNGSLERFVRDVAPHVKAAAAAV